MLTKTHSKIALGVFAAMCVALTASTIYYQNTYLKAVLKESGTNSLVEDDAGI